MKETLWALCCAVVVLLSQDQWVYIIILISLHFYTECIRFVAEANWMLSATLSERLKGFQSPCERDFVPPETEGLMNVLVEACFSGDTLHSYENPLYVIYSTRVWHTVLLNTRTGRHRNRALLYNVISRNVYVDMPCSFFFFSSLKVYDVL